MKKKTANYVCEMVHKQKKEKQQEIVLVAQNIKPRLAKIAYASKKKGKKTVLLLEECSKPELNKTDITFFDRIIFFTDKEDALRKCLLRKPLVYHIFVEAVVEEWAEYLIQNKKKLGKIVYDQYDIYRGFVTDRYDEISKRERYCLENADGLCCRMFETQYLKKKYAYQFQGERLLFLDYCWDGYHDAGTVRDTSKGLRLVYGGRLLAKTNLNNDRYRIELNGFSHIAEFAQNNNAYFVIIPSVSVAEKGYGEYRSLARRYTRLLLKEPMSFHRLIRYESQMDYGIDCVELNADIDAYCEKKNAFNMRMKNKYYATNKYFDYLDAGIMPIYAREGELFGKYLARFGAAFYCPLEMMGEKEEELRKARQSNKKKIYKAVKLFSIENQIERLIKFYERI